MDFPELPERLAEVRGRIAQAAARGGHGQTVKVIAVTKTHGPEAVEAAWGAGILDVGENKVQEAVGKQDALAGSAAERGGLRWHLIGHLQTNKARSLSRFALFHGLDRDGLVDAVRDAARRAGTTFEVLVQVNVSGEESKGGFEPQALEALAARLVTMPELRVRGVMTMAPFDAAERVLRDVFSGARSALGVLRSAGLPAVELSMGMSGDYELAVEEGATMVRLGTILFGARE
ncbi:MAG: YggS family pyridoxal phosphate-dependent enzyme [Gemmatimonadetes bacterium]|nr:YggS family pyridoxal phosphate-dependent enzyme [Gemmatimonadota bacterium]